MYLIPFSLLKLSLRFFYDPIFSHRMTQNATEQKYKTKNKQKNSCFNLIHARWFNIVIVQFSPTNKFQIFGYLAEENKINMNMLVLLKIKMKNRF